MVKFQFNLQTSTWESRKPFHWKVSSDSTLRQCWEQQSNALIVQQSARTAWYNSNWIPFQLSFNCFNVVPRQAFQTISIANIPAKSNLKSELQTFSNFGRDVSLSKFIFSGRRKSFFSERDLHSSWKIETVQELRCSKRRNSTVERTVLQRISSVIFRRFFRCDLPATALWSDRQNNDYFCISNDQWLIRFLAFSSLGVYFFSVFLDKSGWRTGETSENLPVESSFNGSDSSRRKSGCFSLLDPW